MMGSALQAMDVVFALLLAKKFVIQKGRGLGRGNENSRPVESWRICVFFKHLITINGFGGFS
jgi:hypothetical protein